MPKKAPENMTWLLFFYSVPSKPVSIRMRVWRRLAKSGAIQFKGAVYVLPYNEEHYELFQWLSSEVASMNGEASFVKVETIETIKDSELIALFNLQREKDYYNTGNALEELERKLENIKKGAAMQDLKKLSELFDKYSREFNEVQRVDFFSSNGGNILKQRFEETWDGFKRISGMETKIKTVVPRHAEDYQWRTWVTRKKPFVDRMASAWLVKKFIDKSAVFKFIEEKEKEHIDKRDVLFDIAGGEFTHTGTLCTFETLLGSFNLKDKALKKIAEIVHELDIRDGLHQNPETRGVEEILRGIKKTTKDDAEVLKKGMELFEMLYASKIKL